MAVKRFIVLARGINSTKLFYVADIVEPTLRSMSSPSSEAWKKLEDKRSSLFAPAANDEEIKVLFDWLQGPMS